MKHTKAKALLISSVAAIALLTNGCGSSSSTVDNTNNGGSSNTSVSTLSGTAIDGYLEGSVVFVDNNGNGVLDADEPRSTTGPNGIFTLTGTIKSGANIIVSGGTDKSTGKAFQGKLKSAVDTTQTNTVVTPLTTYVAALVKQNLTQSAARAQVAKVLGLATTDLDKDPMKTPTVFLAGQKVQKTIEVTNTKSGLNDVDKIFTSLAKATVNASDFNTDQLLTQVETDHSVSFTTAVKNYLTSYTKTVDNLKNSSTTSLDSIGQYLDTETQKVEDANDASITTITTDAENKDFTNFANDVETEHTTSQGILDNLTPPPTSTTTNITLPTTAAGTIVWTSHNPQVISNSGVVTQAFKDVTVELTARLDTTTTSGFPVTATKDFEITVTAKQLPTGATTAVSFKNLEGKSLTSFWGDSTGYSVITFTANSFTFKDHNENNTTYSETGTLTTDANNPAHATVTTPSNAVYDITIQSKEPITSFKGKDVSSDNVQKYTLLIRTLKEGTLDKFQPSGWTPTYYDSTTSSQQAIPDIITYLNQQIDTNSGWWFDGDSNSEKYMFSSHSPVTKGAIASGNIVKAKTNASSNGYTQYVRTTEVVGHWDLSAAGVLTRTVTGKFTRAEKFIGTVFLEASADAAGTIFTEAWYEGITDTVLAKIQAPSGTQDTNTTTPSGTQDTNTAGPSTDGNYPLPSSISGVTGTTADISTFTASPFYDVYKNTNNGQIDGIMEKITLSNSTASYTELYSTANATLQSGSDPYTLTGNVITVTPTNPTDNKFSVEILEFYQTQGVYKAKQTDSSTNKSTIVYFFTTEAAAKTYLTNNLANLPLN